MVRSARRKVGRAGCRGQRSGEAIRIARSGPWHRLHRRAWRGARAPRPERCRQDHDARDPRGLPDPNERPGLGARRRSRGRRPGTGGSGSASCCRVRSSSPTSRSARCSSATRATTRSLGRWATSSSSWGSSTRPMPASRPCRAGSSGASTSALGIIGAPELLFLDEPTTGFDPSARRGAWELVEKLRGEGTTIILTTHYMDEAQHLADRVVVIEPRRDRGVGHARHDRWPIEGRGADPVRACRTA